MAGDIGKDRYRTHKVEIDQTITRLKDDLYAASQTLNFKHIINRMTVTLSQLVTISPETKKALINRVIQCLDVGNGEIMNLVPQPWAKPFS